MWQQHLIAISTRFFLTSGFLQRLTTQEVVKLLAVKVVVVVYKRWSLTRGFKHSDLFGNFWYFGKGWLLRRGVHLWELAETGCSNVLMWGHGRK